MTSIVSDRNVPKAFLLNKAGEDFLCDTVLDADFRH